MEELLCYDGLIYSIINKYTRRFDLEDLYQVGMIGLINAYKHFDKKYQTKFSSFAYYYIVGEVNKYIRENSGVKISKNIIKLKKNILKAKDMMLQKLGREPTNQEISLYLEIDEEKINTALEVTNVVSLDESYEVASYDDNRPTLLDLRSEIEKLTEEEKELLKARYYNELTQIETSKALGISQVQVSRKENKILQKLKNKL